MVNTRSKTAKQMYSGLNGTDRLSNGESECSVPEVLTREQMNEFDNENLLDYRNTDNRQAVDQRFSEMNRHISELTNLVLMLTEKISSNDTLPSNHREGNILNTMSNEHGARSDMVTGVSTTNPLPNPPRQSTSQYPPPLAHQFDDIVTEIHHLRDTMTDTVQHSKILQTQVPLFRGKI